MNALRGIRTRDLCIQAVLARTQPNKQSQRARAYNELRINNNAALCTDILIQPAATIRVRECILSAGDL
jgi:hypothetical protein